MFTVMPPATKFEVSLLSRKIYDVCILFHNALEEVCSLYVMEILLHVYCQKYYFAKNMQI